MTNAIDALWKRFRLLDVAGKRALKSMVCKIVYPITIRMCPPPENIKPKEGRRQKGRNMWDMMFIVILHIMSMLIKQTKIFKDVMFIVIPNLKEETI